MTDFPAAVLPAKQITGLFSNTSGRISDRAHLPTGDRGHFLDRIVDWRSVAPFLDTLFRGVRYPTDSRVQRFVHSAVYL